MQTTRIARVGRRGAALVAGCLLVAVAVAAPAAAAPGDITTIAGTGVAGFAGDGGPATAAQLDGATGVAVDPSGRVLVADGQNHRIRRIATDGTITTIAGTGTAGSTGDGGPATAAGLSFPGPLAVDGAGNVFVVDGGSRVRRIDAATGTITTVAGTGAVGYAGDGGPATSAQLNAPSDLHVSASGDLYLAEPNSAQIRFVDAATGIITSLTGELPNPGGGPPVTINLNAIGLDVDGVGTIVYADPTLGVVRRVEAGTGAITEVAGALAGGDQPGDGGPALAADLIQPWHVRLDGAGNLFIGDPGAHRIRFVDAATGTITTVAGTGVAGYAGDGGAATAAQVDYPWGLAVTTDGDLIVTDLQRHVVRLVSAASPVPAVPWPGAVALAAVGAAVAAAWVVRARTPGVEVTP